MLKPALRPANAPQKSRLYDRSRSHSRLGNRCKHPVFSVVRAVLLPLLPFPNPGQLVEIELRDRKNLRIERRFATGPTGAYRIALSGTLPHTDSRC